MTRVLHTARISNVDSVMFVDRNKRDVKFWARKINRERCFSSCHEREISEYRFDIEHRTRNPKVWGSVPQRTQNFFFASRLWQDEKLFSLHHEYFHAVLRCPILQKVNKTFSAEKQKNEQGKSFQCFWQKWNWRNCPTRIYFSQSSVVQRVVNTIQRKNRHPLGKY